MVAGLFVDRLDKHLGAFGVVALVLFLVTVACVIAIVVPRRLATSENLLTSLTWYEQYGGHPDAPATYLISATRNLTQDREDNQRSVGRVSYAFYAECGLLGLQLLFWVISAVR